MSKKKKGEEILLVNTDNEPFHLSLNEMDLKVFGLVFLHLHA